MDAYVLADPRPWPMGERRVDLSMLTAGAAANYQGRERATCCVCFVTSRHQRRRPFCSTTQNLAMESHVVGGMGRRLVDLCLIGLAMWRFLVFSRYSLL